MKFFYLGGEDMECMRQIDSRYLSTTKAYFSTLEAVDGVYRWGLHTCVDSDVEFLKNCFSTFIDVVVRFSLIDRGYMANTSMVEDIGYMPKSRSEALSYYCDLFMENILETSPGIDVSNVLYSSVKSMAAELDQSTFDVNDIIEFLAGDDDMKYMQELKKQGKFLITSLEGVTYNSIGYLTFDISFVDWDK